MDAIIEFLTTSDFQAWLSVLGAVVVALTAINGVLAAVAPLTKTDKDDALAAKLGGWIAKIRALLNKVGPTIGR